MHNVTDTLGAHDPRKSARRRGEERAALAGNTAGQEVGGVARQALKGKLSESEARERLREILCE